jgi:hypothetical protein
MRYIVHVVHEVLRTSYACYTTISHFKRRLHQIHAAKCTLIACFISALVTGENSRSLMTCRSGSSCFLRLLDLGRDTML